MMILDFQDGFLKLKNWEFHTRGKNYVSEISGLSVKYKFKQKFLQIIWFDQKPFIRVNDLTVGNIYRFCVRYYTPAGNVQVQQGDGYYVLQDLNDRGGIFRKISESQVRKLVTSHDQDVAYQQIIKLIKANCHNLTDDQKQEIIKMLRC